MLDEPIDHEDDFDKEEHNHRVEVGLNQIQEANEEEISEATEVQRIPYNEEGIHYNPEQAAISN